MPYNDLGMEGMKMNALENEVVKYQKQGWMLVSQTVNVAQFRRPKKGFSCLPNLLCTALFVGGFLLVPNNTGLAVILMLIGAAYPVVYFLAYVFAKRERTMTLFVNERGKFQLQYH